MSSEFWSVLELGAAPRGELLAAAAAIPERGWERVLHVAGVGLSGHWPHAMELRRTSDPAALAEWLDAGYDDGLDESRFGWGQSKLFTHMRGEVSPLHGAYLVQYVTAASPDVVAGVEGATLVLSETLAPWQGLALWGAEDIAALERLEDDGIGAGGDGVRVTQGWWAVVPPKRTLGV